jgi:nicotinate-nucleotide adenylyltransferase
MEREPARGRRVALYGGTFDPFHNGHLRMAVEVLESGEAERVVILPARVPPHKPGEAVSSPEDRLAMAVDAVGGIGGISVSDLDLRREGPSWTVDTIRAAREEWPGEEPLFVLGADSFAEIGLWHRFEELLASCDFLVLPRPGHAGAAALPPGVRVEPEEGGCYSGGAAYRLPGGRRALFPPLPVLDISSRAVRGKVRDGKCIRGLVPPAVERRILDRGLYR